MGVLKLSHSRFLTLLSLVFSVCQLQRIDANRFSSDPGIVPGAHKNIPDNAVFIVNKVGQFRQLLEVELTATENNKFGARSPSPEYRTTERILATANPYEIRISCGAPSDITTEDGTLWRADFGYSGGIASFGTRLGTMSQDFSTIRTFDSFDQNCYRITGVPRGRYWVRVSYGTTTTRESEILDNVLFDVLFEGTNVSSYNPDPHGSNNVLDKVFTESLLDIMDGEASLCFLKNKSAQVGPSILSVELLQAHSEAYYLNDHSSRDMLLRTRIRTIYGLPSWTFDTKHSRDVWGGDRFWDKPEGFNGYTQSTTSEIKSTLTPPNFYPQYLYQSAAVVNGSLDFEYMTKVNPNRRYSVWLHFAETDGSVMNAGQRVFDVFVNGNIEFEDVDIFRMSGGSFTALVLNATIDVVNADQLMITLRPKKGTVMISAIEVFEVIPKVYRGRKGLSLWTGLVAAIGRTNAVVLTVLLTVISSGCVAGIYYMWCLRSDSRPSPRPHAHCL